MPVIIREAALPESLYCFRSLVDPISAGIDARLKAFYQLSGYPVPSNLVYDLITAIDLTDLSLLKLSLLRQRNDVKAAANVSRALQREKREKHQLVTRDIEAYIEVNRVALNLQEADPDRIKLIARLVMSDDLNAESWTLLMPDDVNMNVIYSFRRLYSEIQAQSIALKAGDWASILSYPVFVPRLDAIVPLHQAIPGAESLMDADFPDKEAMKDTVASSLVAQLLADLRIVDVMVSLHLNPAVWDAILPTPIGASPDPMPRNIARETGLRTWAGVLHSALLMPYLYQSELFKIAYERLEEWLGALPDIMREAEALHAYLMDTCDMFGVVKDLRDIVHSLDEVSTTMGCSVKTIPIEFMQVCNLTKTLTDYVPGADEPVSVDFTAIRSLRHNSAYAQLVLSLPQSELAFYGQVWQRFTDKLVYESYLRRMDSNIRPFFELFLPTYVRSDIRALGLKFPWPVSGGLPSTFPMPKHTNAAISRGHFPTPGTFYSMNEDDVRQYEQNRALTFFSADQFAADVQSKPMLDECVVERLAKSMPMITRTFVPAVLDSPGIIYERSHFSTYTGKRTLLSAILGRDFTVAQQSLLIHDVRRQFATAVSSFAVVYLTGGSSVSGDAVPASLVTGYGSPYGTTYAHLAANCAPAITAKDLKAAASDKLVYYELIGLAVVFLDKVPVPSLGLAMERFALNIPYFYAPASELYVPIKDLAVAKPFWNFALRASSSPIYGLPSRLYSPTYSYRNMFMLTEPSIAPKLTVESKSSYSSAIELIVAEWKGERYDTFTDYVRCPSFITSREGSATKDASAHPGQSQTNFDQVVRQIQESQAAAQIQVAKATAQGAVEQQVLPEADVLPPMEHQDDKGDFKQ